MSMPALARPAAHAAAAAQRSLPLTALAAEYATGRRLATDAPQEPANRGDYFALSIRMP